MPAPARTAAATSAFLLVTALAACSGGASGDGPLADALGRVGAGDDVPELIAFSDPGALGELATEHWQTSLAGAPDIGQHTRELSEQLEVDLLEADSLLTVGYPTGALTLVSGGHDGAAVRDASTAAGWTGDEVLTHELDLTDRQSGVAGIAIVAPQLRVTEDSVALGGTSADLLVVDASGDSLADDPTIAALSGCLGDATAAVLEPTAATPIAVGVLGGPAEDPGSGGQSVVCVHGDDPQALGDHYLEAFASGRLPTTGSPYTEYFENPALSVEGDTAQVLLDHTDEVPPGVILSVHARQDLPVPPG
ncbi:hypothetical protein GCM10009718_18950 [Isoptericola halotolerans]|uniref:Uncharacterized protein n=1 Tax=Isoptericola halotolerans TaxID=300560 RepID=A0ABX2A738_9MICO|nr:hypothetical protein [Isoptericola halotolerans]NOV98520.1 hypothetical protein [Isoptericola halotolerans]